MLWINNFQFGTIEKLPTVSLYQCPFLPLILNKKSKNKNTDYHGIMTFKTQFYLRQGSTILLLFVS